jgi:hypothetical protein
MLQNNQPRRNFRSFRDNGDGFDWFDNSRSSGDGRELSTVWLSSGTAATYWTSAVRKSMSGWRIGQWKS